MSSNIDESPDGEMIIPADYTEQSHIHEDYSTGMPDPQTPADEYYELHDKIIVRELILKKNT